MGSCISKCRPKKCHHQEEEVEEECSNIQDKLVISQASTHLSNKISPFPPSPSPSSSTSSVSSFTCSTAKFTTSSASNSSLSTASSKEQRVFSNEFLLSCYKDNPHVIRINSLKDTALSNPSKVAKLDLRSNSVVLKQSTPQRVFNSKSAPQKRLRPISPTSTLTRQKSFRREPEIEPEGEKRLNASAYSHLPNRTLSSPSPSRRFNGEKSRGDLTSSVKENHSKRMIGYKTNSNIESGSGSSCSRKEYIRPVSPNRNLNRPPSPRSCLMNRETFIHRISSKIDEIAVEEALVDQDMLPIEDIDNPLISLDCFIFL